MTDSRWSEILADSSPKVRELAEGAQALIADVVPDAQTEVDAGSKLLGFTFRPGTYKGLFAAVAVHTQHVNIMLSRGAELADGSGGELLEGTGKRARHIKLTSADKLDDSRVARLVADAAQLTKRGLS
jgi:hypothetical protein